ncbi:MAG TPA: alpha-L-fucosidase, partial [Chitinophagaceae bacterium]|nr:alpha-L-fucosidase [Chitinophagaceae bacterium]
IFIHWGVYSVPGFSSKGQYAEWYQNGLNGNDTARIAFHKKKFGDLTYYQLADQFKAELFNPDEWAKVFEQSGAKYIVLTSKHHDGFTLWPSKEANRDWGFPWNAVEVGPKRDLIKDLFAAVRKTSVHAGMYYSLYEWYNPLWKADKNKFVTDHTWPQMKDLINTYQPDVFWTDGDWDLPAETWKSQEFLTWLYNESPVKDRVVVNDRWGAGLRFHHAGIYTPEYQPDLDFEDHYWEESRGMGFSYGYNREEDAWDYNSAQSLVLQLIDKVSSGGNFLLDIGPDEHGKIPPIMQERLLQIGDWMKINGEAIYNTVRWKTPSQWSDGMKGYKPKSGSGDLLLKLTIDPDPGYAVKEVFYTYNEKSNSLYAIFPKYPDNNKLVLKSVTLPAGTAIDFLSTKENCSWKQEGENAVINLPAYNPNKIKAPYAYAVKINNYGMFTKKPAVKVDYKNAMQPIVSLQGATTDVIHYTMDGTAPTAQSTVYTKPFLVDKTSVVQAQSYAANSLPGSIATEKVIRYEWLKPAGPANLAAGLSYKYYEPADKVSLRSVNNTPVAKTGITGIISNSLKQRKEKFVLVFDGYIKIGKDGFYTFSTNSDDGSKLFIGDTEIVDNDGDHGSTEKAGKAALKKGFHKITVQYYDGAGGNELRVFMQAEGGSKTAIPPAILFHEK